ncbi:hypothetical protein Tco_0019353 [Tanacetum coccineum]
MYPICFRFHICYLTPTPHNPLKYLLDGTKAHLLEDKQIPSVGVFDKMAFGGDTHNLGSSGEETDEIMDLHQFHEEILFSERGDGITGIKQRRHDLSSDSVRDLAMAS